MMVAGAVLAIGLGLYLIGLLGGLMAGLIKSAISKQKEYLADASAVQFTRNPEGIGDALKIIGGYAPARSLKPPVPRKCRTCFSVR